MVGTDQSGYSSGAVCCIWASNIIIQHIITDAYQPFRPLLLAARSMAAVWKALIRQLTLHEEKRVRPDHAYLSSMLLNN
jgi:hypothetical protein